MSRLIKLVQLSRLPKRINLICSPIKYKNKDHLLKNLEHHLLLLKQHQKAITDTRYLLTKRGVSVNGKFINVTQSDEKFADNLNSLAKQHNDVINNIKQDMIVSEHFIKIQKKLNKGVSLKRLFPEYDFAKVHGESDVFGRMLHNLHIVAHEIKDGKQWVMGEKNKHVETQIFNNPLIESDGHTGFTISRTRNTLCNIYRYGWQKYIESLFLY